MAYEYEDKINEAFFKAGRDGRNVNRELLAELQEVYQKAKLLDGVVATTKRRLSEEEHKAKAFDHIKVIYDKNMNEMSISDTECIEMIGNELKRVDDEKQIGGD